MCVCEYGPHMCVSITYIVYDISHIYIHGICILIYLYIKSCIVPPLDGRGERGESNRSKDVSVFIKEEK